MQLPAFLLLLRGAVVSAQGAPGIITCQVGECELWQPLKRTPAAAAASHCHNARRAPADNLAKDPFAPPVCRTLAACPASTLLFTQAKGPVCCKPGCVPNNLGPTGCALGCSTAANCGFDLTSTCLGCPPGTYGTITSAGWNCSACPPGRACVGLMDAPVFNFSAGPPTAALLDCPLLAALPATPMVGASVSYALEGYTWLLQIPSVDGVIMGAILFACIVVALFTYSILLDQAPGARLIAEALKKFDLNNEPLAVAMDANGGLYVKCYNTKVPVAVSASGGVALATGTSFVPSHTDGADDKVKRPQGGACALLSIVALLTLVLVLVLQREANNMLSVLAANFLRPSDAAFALTLPFYTSPSWGAGVQVRVMAAGNAGACGALASWEARGFKGGAPSEWSHRAVPDCGGTGVAQHVFQCASCVFTSTSALVMTFDWSCQAFYVEAGSLDATGQVYSDVMSAELTRGAQNAAISTLETFDGLYLSMVNDTASPAMSVRGYALAAGKNPSSHAPTIVTTTKTSSGISYYFPNASVPTIEGCNGTCAGMWDPALFPNVTLIMNLELNTLFTINTLSEMVSDTALLSSIIGLTGIVGLFGQALKYYDKAREKGNEVLRRRSGRSARALKVQPEAAA